MLYLLVASVIFILNWNWFAISLCCLIIVRTVSFWYLKTNISDANITNALSIPANYTYYVEMLLLINIMTGVGRQRF